MHAKNGVRRSKENPASTAHAWRDNPGCTASHNYCPQLQALVEFYGLYKYSKTIQMVKRASPKWRSCIPISSLIPNTSLCLCVHVCAWMHACMICMYICTMYVWCVYVCMYVCMYVCIYVWSPYLLYGFLQMLCSVLSQHYEQTGKHL